MSQPMPRLLSPNVTAPFQTIGPTGPQPKLNFPVELLFVSV